MRSDFNKQPKLLVIDDDENYRRVLSRELSRRGYTVFSAGDGGAGLKMLKENEYDLALLDLKMPGIDGLEVLKQAREENVSTMVVILTGHGTIDTAIKAIQLGAYNYVTKPCPLNELEVTINKALEHRLLVKRNEVLSDALAPPDMVQEFVGASGEFKRILDLIEKVARSDSNVLLLGETGVGKGMVANQIHIKCSKRCEFPFVVVNCGAFQENLLQSELFGHEKGAFTSAVRRKHGLFEVADRGTIFLDEIGDVSPPTQAKLLRIVETGMFRRLGGTEENKVDVRIISATNKNLKEMCQKGHFREDLYFRLSTIQIHVPPLRERPDDIKILIDHFLARLNQRFGQKKQLSRDAEHALFNHNLPGNVRELSNIIEQAFVLSDGDTIGTENLDLPNIRPVEQNAASFMDCSKECMSLREVQRHYIMAVMKHVKGHRSQAAKLLKISVRNLYRILKSYGIETDDAIISED